jgi:hypothetical protein
MRDATLADARKLGLYPSVTEILNIIDKPGLTNWKIDQMMLACLTATRLENESEEAFLKRVKADAQEASAIARDRGQAIHDAVEKVFNGLQPDAEYEDTARKIHAQICDRYGADGWIAEMSFACEVGYGGRIDLINHEKKIVADLKTKENLDLKKPGQYYAYDEHAMQLVAYANGTGNDDYLLVNVFACWSGDVLFHEWLGTDRHWDLFLAAFNLWKLVKNYNPTASADPTEDW